MSRAPVTLSREMKIGLIALLMLALLGGWLVMNNRQQAADIAASTPAAAVNASAQAPADANAGSGTPDTQVAGTSQPTGDATQGSVPAAPGTPGTPGEAVTAPPFPVTDPNGSTPDPTTPAPLPSGINPDTPLLTLNGHNPFRPQRLDVEATTAAGDITPSRSDPGAPQTVTISQPSSSASEINDALAGSGSGGAVPVAPLPGTSTTGGSLASSSGSGVVPITRIPGTTVNVPAPTIPTRPTRSVPASAVTGGELAVKPSGPANTPGDVISIPGSGTAGRASGSSSAPGGSSTAGSSTAGGSSAAQRGDQPVTPPVTAVREPSVTIPGALSQPAGNAAQDAASASAPGNVTAPAEPQTITDTAAAATAQSELDSYVKDQQLVFDAAVLGPVNTGIFRSQKGFLVVTAGQAIADSKVILKEVTAGSATLALGQDTITLQLDKR